MMGWAFVLLNSMATPPGVILPGAPPLSSVLYVLKVHVFGLPSSGEHSSCAMPAVELPPPHLPPRVPGALRRIPPRLHTPGHCTAAPQHLRSTSSTAGHQPAAHRPGTDVEQKMGDLSHGLRSPRLRRSTAVGCVRAQKLCATSSAPADCGGAGACLHMGARARGARCARAQQQRAHRQVAETETAGCGKQSPSAARGEPRPTHAHPPPVPHLQMGRRHDQDGGDGEAGYILRRLVDPRATTAQWQLVLQYSLRVSSRMGPTALLERARRACVSGWKVVNGRRSLRTRICLGRASRGSRAARQYFAV